MKMMSWMFWNLKCYVNLLWYKDMWIKVINIRIWYLIVYMFDIILIVKVRVDFFVIYYSL